LPSGGFPADESYSPELLVGAVSGAGVGCVSAGRAARGRVCGLGAAVPGARAGGAAETALGWAGPFISAAGARLTVVTLPGGPIGGAVAAPTVTLSASGFPAFKIGAAAVGGTL
jgi:hypothetical protein